MGLRLFWRKLKAIRNGRADGKRGIPETNQQEFPMYERQLASVYQSSIDKITQVYREKDRRLKEEYCKAKREIENITDRIEELEPGFKESLKAIGQKKATLEEVVRQVYTVKPSYWFLFAFLAICEFPINSIVFDVLGEAKWLTYIYAAALGVAIPFAAHYVGILFRRESPFKSGTAALKIGTMFAIVIVVLLGIAYLREKFVEGAGITELLGIRLDPRMVTILFLSINVLIFAIAVLASYMAHLDVADEEIKKLNAAKKALKSLEEEEGKVAKTAANLERLKELRDELEEKMARLAQTRLALFHYFKEEAEGFIKTCHWAINIYRNSNMRARKDSKLPVCFAADKYPEINISPFDGTLDEDCGEEV